VPAVDEITLTVPRERPFYRVAHLVLGGLAVRLDLTYDTLEDLQAIAPRELLRGYRFSFGYTVDGVEVVTQHERQES